MPDARGLESRPHSPASRIRRFGFIDQTFAPTLGQLIALGLLVHNSVSKPKHQIRRTKWTPTPGLR